MRVVQGPWQGSGENSEQIWVRLMFLTQPCCCELSGLQGEVSETIRKASFT